MGLLASLGFGLWVGGRFEIKGCQPPKKCLVTCANTLETWRMGLLASLGFGLSVEGLHRFMVSFAKTEFVELVQNISKHSWIGLSASEEKARVSTMAMF